MGIDIENPTDLLTYLRQKGHIGAAETPAMQQLTGGVSNRTVLVTRASGQAWVLKQALSKLRVQADWFSSPARVHREAAGLRRLGELTPPGTIPHLIFEDHETHLIGMAAVAQPHVNWKQLLLEGHLERAYIEQFSQILAAIHKGAWRRQVALAPEFADRSFFESLRLEPYYGYTAEQLPAAAPFLQALIMETRQRAITLVHGDYSPKNILVYDHQLVLLDHEVIHWGDPAFDVGFSLTHLLSKAHFLVQQRAAFTNAAVDYWHHYAHAVAEHAGTDSAGTERAPDGTTANQALWGKELEAFAVRHTLACLLARACGRSPLEYLSQAQRNAQAKAALQTIQAQPATMDQMIESFVSQL